MAQKDPSKTERATSKRRNKARDKGNVPKSQEVTKTLTILAGLMGLVGYIETLGNHMQMLFRHFLGNLTGFVPEPGNVYAMGLWLAQEVAIMLLPLMVFIAAVAWIAMRLQVGKLWTTEVFKFSLDKFNVFAAMKRMFFSPQTFFRLGKSLLQALVIGIAPYIVLKQEANNLLPLYYQNAHAVSAYLLDTSYRMVSYALIPMACIAAADLWYTRWDYEENLKMTKDEVKDERKQAEGDPVVKSQQRRKMMQAMAQRMLQDVPKADVVITNPTHLAIALRYNPTEAPAPVVLAKGADHLAAKIREVAREHNIPIRENKPLARALYKSVEVGDAIPQELFKAVAAVLATLMKFKVKVGS